MATVPSGHKSKALAVVLLLVVCGLFCYQGNFGLDVTPAPTKDAVKGVPQKSIMERVCDSDIRVRNVRTTCSLTGWSHAPMDWENTTDRFFIVDDRHKVLFCDVPKAASTSMRWFMASMVVKKMWWKHMHPIATYANFTGFRLLHQLPIEERDTILRDYKKFMIVRHPFDRLFSAYINKMRKPGDLNCQVLTASIPVINEYLTSAGRPPSNGTFDCFKDVLTLQDFLYLVANKADQGFMNEHWRSYDYLCRPCQVKYDYVFRSETMEKDIEVLFSYYHWVRKYYPKPFVLPHVNDMSHVQNIDDKLDLTARNLSVVDPDIMRKLYQRFEKDFEVFGYTWDMEKGGANCQFALGNGGTCC